MYIKWMNKKTVNFVPDISQAEISEDDFIVALRATSH